MFNNKVTELGEKIFQLKEEAGLFDYLMTVDYLNKLQEKLTKLINSLTKARNATRSKLNVLTFENENKLSELNAFVPHFDLKDSLMNLSEIIKDWKTSSEISKNLEQLKEMINGEYSKQLDRIAQKKATVKLDVPPFDIKLLNKEIVGQASVNKADQEDYKEILLSLNLIHFPGTSRLLSPSYSCSSLSGVFHDVALPIFADTDRQELRSRSISLLHSDFGYLPELSKRSSPDRLWNAAGSQDSRKLIKNS